MRFPCMHAPWTCVWVACKGCGSYLQRPLPSITSMCVWVKPQSVLPACLEWWLHYSCLRVDRAVNLPVSLSLAHTPSPATLQCLHQLSTSVLLTCLPAWLAGWLRVDQAPSSGPAEQQQHERETPTVGAAALRPFASRGPRGCNYWSAGARAAAVYSARWKAQGGGSIDGRQVQWRKASGV